MREAYIRLVSTDYDGDGRADRSIASSEGSWYIDFATNGCGSWDLITAFQ